MLRANRPADQPLYNLLARHPRVEFDQAASPEAAWSFCDGPRSKTIYYGGQGGDTVGLVETMDNNPMVCAQSVRVPAADATLALIALSPLLRAGILRDAPVVVLSFEPACSDLEDQLHRIGLEESPVVHVDALDLAGVFSANVMAEVSSDLALPQLEALFDEAYGRSFFVRGAGGAVWDAELVAGKPWAAYRLRLSPGDGNSLLTVQVLADADGKCGAAQVVHAMNIMCGFEETLGLEP